VYYGEVKPGCGLPVVLEALRLLQTQQRYVKLIIIGRARGDYLEELHETFRELFDSGLCKYEGPINVAITTDKARLNRTIARASGAFAIFPGGALSTSNFVIPNRVLLYLENGTPIIINDDSAVANWLVSSGVAIASKARPGDVANSIIMMLDSVDYRLSLRANIRELVRKLSTDTTLETALLALLQRSR
jgi:glycosyltransferase involved in cell wall biosynthesis